MSGALFTGLGVALATPFTTGAERTAKRRTATAGGATADGATANGGTASGPAAGGATRKPPPEVDLAAYRRLVEHVVAGGADFLVVLGSTGEAATVTDRERDVMVALTCEIVGEMARDGAGTIPVVVGVGHNSTESTIGLAERAVTSGADGLLVVTPYYNKPQPAGIEAHFRSVCEAVPGVPVIAYNVPGRTGVNLTPSTLRRLWTIPEVVAVKESSGDLRQIAQACVEAPTGRHVLAGDDDLALASVAVGARGLISVCANVVPRRTAHLVRAATQGQMEQARTAFGELLPLMSGLSAETNPVPLKAALACVGLGTATVRPPLAPASPQTWSAVQAALAGLGVGRVDRVDRVGRAAQAAGIAS